MTDTLFSNILTGTTGTLTPVVFLSSIAVSLLLGLVIAAVYMFRSSFTRSFVLTLALLPSIVCVVILMVNGNIGAGIAVMGAFNLVRFRSVAGSAKEIGTIFLAMAAGLVVGMGYPAYAALFTLVLAGAMAIYQVVGLGAAHSSELERTLRITIPEDLNYMGVFDDVFERFTSCAKQTSVRTCNMGSLFKLTYDVTMLPQANEKDFLDELRCRNGNLEISITQRENGTETGL